MPGNKFFNQNDAGYVNPSFWSEGYSSYAIPSAGERGNDVTGTFLDPFGDVSGLYNDIMGLTSQSREFAHQEYMTDKENEWNSAQAQMERAREAGINLNTAAAGIAGAGASSVAPAGGSASPVQSPISAGAEIAQTSSNLGLQSSQREKALADAEKARAEARRVDDLADAEILSKAGAFAKALTESGTPEIAAMELGLKIVRGGLDGIAHSLKGDGICRLIQSQQDKIEADYSKTWKEIERMEKLLPLEVDEQTKKNSLLDIEERKQKAIAEREEKLSQLWIRYDGDPYLDLYQRQYQIYHDYGPDSPQYQAFLSMVKDGAYYRNLGHETASMEIDWLRPPQSAIEATAMAAHAIGNYITQQHQRVNSGQLSYAEAFSQACSNPNFQKAYYDAKVALKEKKDQARKAWKDSRGMNTQERARLYNAYQEALRAYDEFDKRDFFEMTWNNPLFSPEH